MQMLMFKPIFKNLVWGGRKLERVLGKRLPTGPVGESWELVDLPGDQSVVADGPLAGCELQQLVRDHRGELLGPVPPDGGRFPLLVKYIDAAKTLSVQVHPDERTASALGGRPKNEAWTILDVEPGAKLYLGLRPGATPEELERRIEAGTVEELLHAVEPRAGDLVPVRPGTVHAIGAGVLLAEVQQPSDTTYRIYDWGRVGLDGKPRPLHIEESLAAIDFDARVPCGETKHDAGHFKIELASIDSAEERPGEGPLVLVSLGGRGEVSDGEGGARAVERGDVVLVPHAARPARLVGRPELRAMIVTF